MFHGLLCLVHTPTTSSLPGDSDATDVEGPTTKKRIFILMRRATTVARRAILPPLAGQSSRKLRAVRVASGCHTEPHGLTWVGLIPMMFPVHTLVNRRICSFHCREEVFLPHRDCRTIIIEPQVNGKTLQMEINTGAAVVLISASVQKREYPTAVLHPSDVQCTCVHTASF